MTSLPFAGNSLRAGASTRAGTQIGSSQPTSMKTGARKPIRLLLADDHPVVRKGLTSCLAQAPNVEVVGEATDGQETIRKAKELAPDLVLMDIDMPLLNGLTAADILRKENPAVKVLILSMHNDSEFVMRILQSGARGYVLKQASTEELLKAIETIHAGDVLQHGRGATRAQSVRSWSRRRAAHRAD